ncbi:type IV secretory system conjugative DNA transfer family protein [Cytobacillus sp. IB215665]|uniref:type IV secretory system conjugative DNA transfer family protein n=1 Tax=Cytobacillus sp. IB215665 TaxID=3097357 RepID=UPI002A0B532C|nr:TraM recognition domain-containing protein [Cytobacillus sp. IB215665]MDX8367668.1 TraM recognition domain-containing protein [Cytobacillus sp. IB215665]
MAKPSEKKSLSWGRDDAFTHTLIVGPTRCGKTATILKPIIYQILDSKRKGRKVGLSVIEPKGDVAAMVKEICTWMEIDCVHIDPTIPNSDRLNVMQGDKDDVAEATVAVLKSLFGKQEAFFATVQELSTRKITLMLKELYGDNMDITDVLTNLRDPYVLEKNIHKLQEKQGNTELVKFFTHELLGSLKDKYQQLIIGLRAQMENITSNDHLKRVITGKSTFSIDEHFEIGGVLAVNTALGKLGKAGDAFGQFVAMHLQLGTFRRKGTEKTRVDHYMIIDEYSRYINPDVERWLSISAEYRVAGMFAIQSIAQLEVEAGQLSGKAMKQAILTSTRNKIIFGGLSSNDAKELAQELGQDRVVYKNKLYSGNPLKSLIPKGYSIKEEDKDRFPYTLLMDGLPRFHFVHKLLQDGHPQPPGIALGTFLPRDWKELIIKEDVHRISQEEQKKAKLVGQENSSSNDNKNKNRRKEVVFNLKPKNDPFLDDPFEEPVEDNNKQNEKTVLSPVAVETSTEPTEDSEVDNSSKDIEEKQKPKEPVALLKDQDDDFW